MMKQVTRYVGCTDAIAFHEKAVIVMASELNALEDETAQLEADLAAHIENEGDECPLCLLEAENDKYIAEIAGMRDKWTPPDEVAKFEAEIEALRSGHFKQLAETDYCYVCGGHGHSHTKDCILMGRGSKFCLCEKPYITYKAVPPMCLYCGKEKG